MKKEEILFSNAMMLYMADNIKSAKSNPSTLWNMVCHTFGIDTENEEFGKMFDDIWENNYIKTDILSLGSDKILELSKNKMKKETQKQIVKEVKGVLPTVVEFMENNENLVNDFDYGYLYGAGVWEASFFKVHEDETEDLVFYFTASSDSELIEKIKNGIHS